MDDPFSPYDAIPINAPNLNEYIAIAITQTGGHVAFPLSIPKFTQVSPYSMALLTMIIDAVVCRRCIQRFRQRSPDTDTIEMK